MKWSGKKKLHVLVATPLGPGGKGGIDRMMNSVQEEFARCRPEGVEVRFGTTRGQGHILLSPLFVAKFIMRMIILRMFGRCDLVHINLASNGSTLRKMVIAAVAYCFGIRYVAHLHGGLYRDYYSSSKYYTRAGIRMLFARAGKVIVLGNIWRNFVIHCKMAASERIIVLPNAAPFSAQLCDLSKVDRVRILFLGHLGALKGTPVLLRALAAMQCRNGWRAVVAGDGQIEEARADAIRFGIAEKVSIPGWVGPQHIGGLLADADILVLPSFLENLPMSVIEAMACGLAVLTTPVGAIPDIIRDGETGLLVPPGDVQALAVALARLVDDAPLRRRLGTAAQSYQRRHLEIKSYARALCEIWKGATR